MTTEAIKEAIAKPPADAKAQLAAWLAEQDMHDWDRQIEEDFSVGGRGIGLLEDAEADVREVRVKPMDEFLAQASLRGYTALEATLVKATELVGEVDDNRQLHAQVPPGFPAGPVRVILIAPEEDEAGLAWAAGLSAEWSEELSDPKQDIYTLDDGQPVNAAR